MRVRINVDFEVPQRVKRALKIAAPVLVILAGGVVWANVPNTFKDGDTLSSQTMNANFTSLDTRLAALEARSAKETHDGGMSVNATFCGASVATTPGDLSGLSVQGAGYAKARNQCTQTCSSPSAHMCTSEELSRSGQLAIATPTDGWYSTATYESEGATGVSTDCGIWTNATATAIGPHWKPTGPNTIACNAALPVLCCD